MFIVLDLPHSACPYRTIILFMFDIDFIVLPDGIEPYRLLDHLCRQMSVITSCTSRRSLPTARENSVHSLDTTSSHAQGFGR